MKQRTVEIRFVPRPAGHSYDATLRWLAAEGKRLRRQSRKVGAA